MKKEAILSSTITFWSAEDDCFVTASPLFPPVAGVGDSMEEAEDVFRRALDHAYIEYLEGNVLGFEPKAPGRPAKNGVNLHTLVKPAVKEQISELATALGVSLGEAIEFLHFFFEKAQTSEPDLFRRMPPISKRSKKHASYAKLDTQKIGVKSKQKRRIR